MDALPRVDTTASVGYRGFTICPDGHNDVGMPNVDFPRFCAKTGQAATGPAAADLTVSLLASHGQRRTAMGYSRYDAAARGRAAWNVGKIVGTKRPSRSGRSVSFGIGRSEFETAPCSISQSLQPSAMPMQRALSRVSPAFGSVAGCARGNCLAGECTLRFVQRSLTLAPSPPSLNLCEMPQFCNWPSLKSRSRH
jgi:hypothetical protein